MLYISTTCAILSLSGCIGTDFIDESVELFDPRIVVTPTSEAIEIDQSFTYSATYYDSTDSPVPVEFSWASSNEQIASISHDGTVTGLQTGQVEITAEAFGVLSENALLTVVADPNQIAFVNVQPADTSMTVGRTLQFTAKAENALGNEVTNASIGWSISPDSLASISSNGLVSAIEPGTVEVTAMVDGVVSIPALLRIFATSRSGKFQKTPGTSYNVEGTAILEQTETGLQLRFLDDFTVTNGPDLRVYLSSESRVNGRSFELGVLQVPSGEQTYVVPSSIEMNQFDYVVIHCLPFNVSFGFARLN